MEIEHGLKILQIYIFSCSSKNIQENKNYNLLEKKHTTTKNIVAIYILPITPNKKN
jgi:hypothetical protein